MKKDRSVPRLIAQHHADIEEIAVEAIRISEMSQMLSSYAIELREMQAPNKAIAMSAAALAITLATATKQRAERVSELFGGNDEIAAVRAARHAAQQAHWDTKEIERAWKQKKRSS